MLDFTIKTEKFEGPLDLLLDLIEKKKLHISEFTLKDVVDDYLSYIENRGPFPIDSASQFLLIASILILIKSKSLLPYLELEKEEETEIGELELRLKIFNLFKETGQMIERLYGKKIIYSLNPPPRTRIFAPGTITENTFQEVTAGLLKRLPQPKLQDEVRVKKTITLEDMIEKLQARIARALRLSFREFSVGEKAQKVDIIVGFLAMLELVKQGFIKAEQERHFGEIFMESGSVGVPRYE